MVDAAVGRKPLEGRGVRVLCLDGGGMRGLAMVKMINELEARTGACTAHVNAEPFHSQT